MIRKFKNDDLLDIMEIWLNANIDAHSFISADYWKNNFDTVKQLIPQAEVFVYEEDGNVLGFIGLMDEYIAGIFVDKLKRSNGIGFSLLHMAKEKKNRLVLSVYSKNERAIQFYKKAGFHIKECKLDEETKEEEYIMYWERDKFSHLKIN